MRRALKGVEMDAYKARLVHGEWDSSSSPNVRSVAINGGEYSLILPRMENIWLMMTPYLDFEITSELASLLAARIEPYEPDVIVGIASLGWSWAEKVACRLGHDFFVPICSTKKFWYEDCLQAKKGNSITSGNSNGMLYLPDEIAGQLRGRTVAVIDDVLCRGASMQPALDLVQQAGGNVVVVGVVLTEGGTWQTITDYPIEYLGHIPLENE